ncbi:MAG: preprotein translocase subunit SecE [Deltaproteobacteria bacterium]|nr:preprotein translocase subunit SecE [Deltaproteobacteria bacterium]
MIQKLQEFFREAKVELKKVTWPDRKVTGASTAVVLIVVIIVAVYLGIVDTVLNQVYRLLLS